MSRSTRPTSLAGAGRRQPYHHGDLRTALLTAARQVAEAVGVEPLTLREVARRAGVSHAAPYHHFPDKAALLRALAADAFRILTERLESAAATRGSARRKLEAIGVAYVEFALAHPVEFRFMFRRDLAATKPSADGVEALVHAGECAYAVLVNAIAACQRAGLSARANPQLLTLTAWSTVHGLAELLLNDPTGSLGGVRANVEEVAKAVVQTLQKGLLAGR